MSWWQVIYTPAWTEKFRLAVLRRIPNGHGRAADLLDEMRQELALRFREHTEAPLAPEAFILASFRNALEDHLRRTEGFPRPPRWVQKLGGCHLWVHKLLCLEGRPLEEIVDLSAAVYQYTRELVQRVARELKAGDPQCGGRRRSVSLDDALPEIDAQHHPYAAADCEPAASLSGAEREMALRTILADAPQASHGDALWVTSRKWWTEFQRRVRLSDDDRLLLRLVFTEGRKVSEAARVLGVSESKARRTMEKVLTELRTQLGEIGISAGDI